ncbi:C6 zinc finger domain-containing protein [Metarhizium album ARSEF 1941]|uniref:C6 zinc finger domain-containing protein n=1 Tax=Metarhizium album (strain ARSEF 1941) TaxID=1081103 RepID=A0A0B2X297_METAS|nr:C6 zinc finger domain-containing protein [Metarhizium album ARSEF 1941]KHN99345.1 C6 zinc finger domain-containing protein [Metarhizium album ARSEF 1941]
MRDSRRASLICHGPTNTDDWSSETLVMIKEPHSHGSKCNDDMMEFIATQDELNYLQAFADGVGVWMDSLNSGNHFTQVIPWHALRSSVLLNSLMACGAKHLSLSKPELEDRATGLYNTATAQLVRMLQNPERNIVDCTTASILLNAYEAMSHKPMHKMSHMVGARALIRECGWNAASTGIPASCFWLSIGMEVLSCLSMNWMVTWHPDDWGLDLDWSHDNDLGDGDGNGDGDSQTWVHRSFYILAKVVNFRATSLTYHSSDPHKHQSRLSDRLTEWQALKQLCDDWNNCSPRSMRPVGYLARSGSSEPSVFPKFWLAQTSAMLGRIFYHTAQCVLAQVNPIESSEQSPEMKELQLHHARQVMGIVASDRDRSVMTIAFQAVDVAFLSLVSPKEREEASSIIHQAQTSGHGAGLDPHRTTRQRPLAVTDLSQRESVSALSLPFEQSWFRAANMSNCASWEFGNQQDGSEPPPVDNPLESAYFGHVNQPYKTWHQPVCGNGLEAFSFGM